MITSNLKPPLHIAELMKTPIKFRHHLEGAIRRRLLNEGEAS